MQMPLYVLLFLREQQQLSVASLWQRGELRRNRLGDRVFVSPRFFVVSLWGGEIGITIGVE